MAHLKRPRPFSWARPLALPVALLLGCTGPQKAKDRDALPETALELAYDDGHASERPLLPPAGYEWLIKFEPTLSAYRPLRLRLLLAQPGPLRLALYAADAAGHPGALLRTLERTYAPELTSGGQDGKWLLETLGELPVQSAAIFVGVSVPAPGNDAARLWASAHPSPQVFQRDAEPGTALQSSRLPLTPLLRLELVPAAAPALPAAAPAATPATAPAAPSGTAAPAPPAAPADAGPGDPAPMPPLPPT